VKRLLIVWASATGGSAQMANATAAAARTEAEVQVALQRAADTTAAQVQAADGYVFATPENLGSMAGLMKDFFDRVYYDVLDQVDGRPYAALICAGSDGSGAARQLARIATGWRLREVAPPLIICTRAQTREQILAPKIIATADLQRCAEVGAALAAGLAAGVF
jgi:hypothetical protein